MNTLLFSAGINKISTLQDGTIKVELITQELPIAQMAQIFQLKKDIAMVAIAPIGEKIDKFDPATMDIPKDKSPATQLRNVLYRVWEMNKQGYDDFNQWYVLEMTRIKDHYKNKLD